MSTNMPPRFFHLLLSLSLFFHHRVCAHCSSWNSNFMHKLLLLLRFASFFSCSVAELSSDMITQRTHTRDKVKFRTREKLLSIGQRFSRWSGGRIIITVRELMLIEYAEMMGLEQNDIKKTQSFSAYKFFSGISTHKTQPNE